MSDILQVAAPAAYRAELIASDDPAVRRRSAIEAALELIHASNAGNPHTGSLSMHLNNLSAYADAIEKAGYTA